MFVERGFISYNALLGNGLQYQLLFDGQVRELFPVAVILSQYDIASR
ncbi:MAG: hypothetical protein IKL03_05995 [Bacteroidaceae bacterium]|nr:hypothetical protein [Bacteroidaceae bacterium]